MVSPTVLLAIKPQIFPRVAAEIAPALKAESEQAIISIMAGISLAKIEEALGKIAAIRAMPNTPATVGAGMTAIAASEKAAARHRETAEKIFQAVGEVVEISENLMDAVTGLSGSGPAYVALFLESLADGGVAAGLPRAIASKLALQTVLGSAQLLQATQMHPALLKDRVTSPGGTTIAGISELENCGFRSALIAAVKAASDRARELG